MTSGVSDVVQAVARNRTLDWLDHWSVPVWRFLCPYSKRCVKFFYAGTLSGTTSGVCIIVFHTTLPGAVVYLKHPASFIKPLNIFVK